MSLKTYLASIASPRNDNEEWAIFIDAHRSYLLANSTKTSINLSLTDTHLRMPKTVLAENGIKPEDAWIILYINGIRQVDSINENITSLYIPNATILDTLKASFDSAG